jgi:surface protein
MVAFFWLPQYFDQGSFFRLLFLCVDYECIRNFFPATVFRSASAFNGDLTQWDVAKITDMQESKLIRIVENGMM